VDWRPACPSHVHSQIPTAFRFVDKREHVLLPPVQPYLIQRDFCRGDQVIRRHRVMIPNLGGNLRNRALDFDRQGFVPLRHFPLDRRYPGSYNLRPTFYDHIWGHTTKGLCITCQLRAYGTDPKSTRTSSHFKFSGRRQGSSGT
jgi:hypothetical protein